MKVTIYEFNEKEFNTIMSIFGNLEQAISVLEEAVTGLESTVAEEPGELASTMEGFLTRLGDIGARLVNATTNVEGFSQPPVPEADIIVPDEETPDTVVE